MIGSPPKYGTGTSQTQINPEYEDINDIIGLVHRQYIGLQLAKIHKFQTCLNVQMSL